MNELEILNKIMSEIEDLLCSPENDYYFDGVFDAYKIVRKYRDKLIEKGE